MTRFALTLALGLAVALPTYARDDKFTLTGDTAKVTFTGTKTGGKHEGGFKKLAGTATATGTDPATLKIELEIETDSLFSDDEKLTKHLKSPDFFNVAEFPKATFKVTKVEKSDKGYTQTGDLTMLGKTKEVSIPSTIKLTAEGLTIDAEFKIKRSDWGMVYGKGKVDDEVALKIELKAKK